jgi:hypothetical protein
MRSASAERCIDCCTHALGCRRLVLKNQNEIHQIPHAAVWRLTRSRVSVKLLRSVLLDGECRYHNRRNAGETEPVFALDALERLEDFVSDAEVDVELHERSTIETGIHWKTRSAFWSLIQFGHRLAHDECEEVGQVDRHRELEPFSERDRVSHASLNAPDRQVEVLCRPRHVESHLERIAALEDPTVANGLGRVEHACEEPIERDLPAQPMQINSITACAFVEPRLECGSKRPGACVLALSCHRVPASEFCRSVVVPGC